MHVFTMRRIAGMAMACWVGLALTCAAQSYWQYGGVDHDWSTAGNWTAGEPNSGVNAHVGDTSGDSDAVAVIGSANEQCNYLYVGSDAGTRGTLTITGGDLTMINYAYVGGLWGAGIVTQTAGTVTCPSYLYLGYASGSDGTYVLNGGHLSVGTGLTIARNDGSTGLYRQTGGTNQAAAVMLIQNAGGSAGAELSGGLLDITGIGASLLIPNAAGTATFEQTGGEVRLVNGSTLIVGNGATSTGTYSLAAGKLSADKVTIGQSGHGKFLQTGGTNDNADLVYLGGTTTGIGEYAMKGGTWTCSSVVILGASAGCFGSVEGYGDVNHSFFRLNQGICRADGDGTDKDLDLTGCGSIQNSIANGTSETNGWYAVDCGRLLWPSVGSAATMYLGELNGPDLVNAVRLGNFTDRGAGSIEGMLYATDHGGVPVYSGDATAVWKLDPSMTFTDVDVTFRYDHAAAAEAGIAEADLKVYSNDGIGGPWTQETDYSVDTVSKLITASNQTALAWFIVGDNISSGTSTPSGTLITIR